MCVHAIHLGRGRFRHPRPGFHHLHWGHRNRSRVRQAIYREALQRGWSLRSIATANPQLAEKIRTETDYFERNAERMRYPRFRRQHLFVGSGVIEAGCKTVVGSRLKQSGMFWTVRGANAILALRCSHLNGRFEDYWEQRWEAQAA